MSRRLLVSFVVGLLSICASTSTATAQYGYPSGYGGYGWGGWGSTPQSTLARGLGAFNMGRGVYNEDTALARSINTDTVMRWNQYAYQSHVTATNNYRKFLLARRTNINRARAEIQDRLRNHPSTRDITDSDALNVLYDVLSNPEAGGSNLRRISTPLKPEVIQDIPFALASEGLTICLDQMTMKEQWPLALRVDDFKPEREGLRKAVQAALEQDKEGDLEPTTIEAVQSAIDQLRFKFDRLVPATRPDYIAAHDTIKALAGLTKMLYSPKAEEILAELEDYQGTTLGDLLTFMQSFNLRFAPANSFRQRRIYLKLYPLLAEQANGVPGPTVAEGEEAVTKAASGMKSAAVDFFKGMDWKHLSGAGSSGSKKD